MASVCCWLDSQGSETQLGISIIYSGSLVVCWTGGWWTPATRVWPGQHHGQQHPAVLVAGWSAMGVFGLLPHLGVVSRWSEQQFCWCQLGPAQACPQVVLVSRDHQYSHLTHSGLVTRSDQSFPVASEAGDPRRASQACLLLLICGQSTFPGLVSLL